MAFDWTLSIGDLIKSITLLALALVAWNNLRWRITNLEVWRKEHMVDSNMRDEIIQRMDKLVGRIDALINDRRAFIRSEYQDPYDGPERRRK